MVFHSYTVRNNARKKIKLLIRLLYETVQKYNFHIMSFVKNVVTLLNTLE